MFIYFMHTMPGTASCSPRPLHHCTTQISTTYMHSNKMHHGAFRQDILRHVISYELSSVQSTSLCVPVRVCVRLCICVFVSNGLIAYVWTTGGKTAWCLHIVCEWPTRKASSLQQPRGEPYVIYIPCDPAYSLIQKDLGPLPWLALDSSGERIYE